MTPTDDPVQRVSTFFETLTPASLKELADHYTRDARFKDPFNDVQGIPAIEAVFTHMFATLAAPRFVVLEAVHEGSRCFLTWDFHFRQPRLGDGEVTVHGGSLLHFAPDGRIVLHRDYWDPAEELYEKLPLLGALMRWLKRRARA